jgi:hypothetical protein
MSKKATNPKNIFAAEKLPLQLWPTTATAAGCLAILNGALKYGAMNWREAGVKASVYVGALKRHIDAWFEGEDVDPDDGVPHLSAALACVAILVDAEAYGKLVDDRAYPGTGVEYRQHVNKLTANAQRLKALHKGKNPKHWTKNEKAKHSKTES